MGSRSSQKGRSKSDYSNMRATYISKETGKRLAEEHPEISDMYRAGRKVIEMAKEFDPKNFEVSPWTAQNSIYIALKILIPAEELKKIAYDNSLDIRRQNGREKGRKDLENRTGLFGMNEQEYLAARHKAGVIGGSAAGKKLYQEKKGVFAEGFWTPEKQKKRLESLGLAPYFGENRETDLGLMEEAKYVFKLKSQGLPWKEITERTNNQFNHNRSIATLITNYNSRFKEMYSNTI